MGCNGMMNMMMETGVMIPDMDACGVYGLLENGLFL